MWFKACPRCKGEWIVDEEIWGKRILCLQCGFSKDLGKLEKPLEPDEYREGFHTAAISGKDGYKRNDL